MTRTRPSRPVRLDSGPAAPRPSVVGCAREAGIRLGSRGGGRGADRARGAERRGRAAVPGDFNGRHDDDGNDGECTQRLHAARGVALGDRPPASRELRPGVYRLTLGPLVLAEQHAIFGAGFARPSSAGARTTIIDARGAGRVVRRRPPGSRAVLAGVTVTGGTARPWRQRRPAERLQRDRPGQRRRRPGRRHRSAGSLDALQLDASPATARRRRRRRDRQRAPATIVMPSTISGNTRRPAAAASPPPAASRCSARRSPATPAAAGESRRASPARNTAML